MLSLQHIVRHAYVARIPPMVPRTLSGLRLQASTFASLSTDTSVQADLKQYFANKHPKNNVPDSIVEKLDRKLHLTKNHPLNIIKSRYVILFPQPTRQTVVTCAFWRCTELKVFVWTMRRRISSPPFRCTITSAPSRRPLTASTSFAWGQTMSPDSLQTHIT